MSKSLPDVYEADEDDSNEVDAQNNSASVDSERQAAASESDDIVMHYGLDTYDEEDNDAPLFAGGPKNLMAFKANEEDPYITLPPEEDDDDLEDFVIRSSDLVMLTAVTEEDQLSHLDVVVIPEALTEFSKSNDEECIRAPVPEAYVHHDYLLPAFPLSVQWLGVPSSEAENGVVNLAAIGTFDPIIEIWDLDVVDSPAPAYALSGHTSAVISLHAHPSPQLRNLLASGSADGSVKLWDISRAAPPSATKASGTATADCCLQSLNMHAADKIQAVRWHPSEPSILCSASIGKSHSVVVADVRQSAQAIVQPLLSDAETLMWLDSQRLLISTEDGEVVCLDIAANKVMWRLDAHNGPCAGISLTAVPNSNPLVPILATCSPSKQSPLKLWALSPNAGPRCLHSKTDGLGKLFTASFSYDLPFVLACGGQSQMPQFINILEFPSVYRVWSGQDSPFSPGSNSAEMLVDDPQFEARSSRKGGKKKAGKR